MIVRNSTISLALFLACLGVWVPTMALSAQGNASIPEEIPSTLVVTNGPIMIGAGPGQPVNNENVSLTNNDTSPLVAYVYEATCGKVMHTRGYSDATLVHGEPPVLVGKTISIAAVAMGCHVPLTAAVFADGRWFGNPADLDFIRARRKAAQTELSTVMKEVAAGSVNHKFDPGELEVVVTKYKSALDQRNWRNYPNREEEARKEVLDELEHQLGIYHGYQAENPGDAKLDSDLAGIIDEWFAGFNRTNYPDSRLHLFRPRRP